MNKKIKLGIWIGLMSFVVGAATLTVDIPANDVPRVSKAFGVYMGLGRNATMNEVAFAVRTQFIIPTTYQAEGRDFVATYNPTPLEMVPTPTPTATATPTATGTPSPTPTPTLGLKTKK